MPNNPYQPPIADSAALPSTLIGRAASLTIAGVVGVVHLGMVVVASQVGEVLQGFGTEVPKITQAFSASSPLCYILPGLCGLAFFARSAKSKVAMPLFISAAVGTALLVPVFIYAMYLPVFRL